MATTINLELKKAPTSAGTYPVYIRITKDKKHKRIVTSVALQKISHWNPKGAKNNNWVRSGERDAAKLNDTLAKELDAVRALYREDKQASVDAIAKKAKNQEASTSFLAFALAVTEELGALGRSNAKHYKTLCNKLQGFLEATGRQDLAFSDLSPALLSDFEAYLQKESNLKMKKEERRLHPNYIRTLLVKFRALVNRAIKEERMPASKYPFNSHPIPKEVETGREALDEEEVAAIVALEYPEGTWIWHTKNAFLFSFYCAGIRAGDLLQLRWANIKDEGCRLEYVMDKNHKQRSYPLMPQAKQILALYRTDSSKPSDYIFPLLDSSAAYAKNADIDTLPVDLKKALFSQIYSKNTLLNRYLKKIAQDAGIEKTITFHISRHTFASISRKKNVPSKVVQEALAHSSLQTTERYLHTFSTDEIDSALQVVFAAPDAPKKKRPSSRKSKVQARLEALVAALEAGEQEELLEALQGRLQKGK